MVPSVNVNVNKSILQGSAYKSKVYLHVAVLDKTALIGQH